MKKKSILLTLFVLASALILAVAFSALKIETYLRRENLQKSQLAEIQKKESLLRSNLQQVRNAIALYESMGDYPKALQDLMAQNPPKGVGGRGIKLKADAWAGGPYFLGGIPVDPMTGTANWKYDPKTGKVHSRSKERGLNFIPYSAW